MHFCKICQADKRPTHDGLLKSEQQQQQRLFVKNNLNCFDIPNVNTKLRIKFIEE